MKSQLEKIKVLDGSHLKWIAMISMLIDHFNKAVLLNYLIDSDSQSHTLWTVNSLFDILGRIAFPIFLFLLVEGFKHTGSRFKYLVNLIIFGLISEIPYNMCIAGTLLEPGAQNMFFTLALALVCLWIIDRIELKSKFLYIASSALICVVFGFISAYLGLDYDYYGIVIPVVFYIFYNHLIIGSIISYLSIIKEIYSILGFLIINMYTGNRGKINKWIGYIFYPLHLLILGLIRMYVTKA